MQTTKDTLIGRLTEVTGDHFNARLEAEGDDFVAERMFGMNKVRVGQIGSYMTVKQGDSNILVMVDRMWREVDDDHRVQYMVRLSPLGELNADGDFTRGVNHYPSTGADLHLVSMWELEKVFSEHSENDYKVGKLSAFEGIDVCLDASAFFGRHAAILGQSGAGKSWTVTSLIQAALRAMPKAHIILLDMHGEYSDSDEGVAVKSPFPAGKTRCIKAQDLEFPYWLLRFSEIAELIVDPADPDASTQTSYMRSVILRMKRDVNKHLDLGHITVDSPVFFSMDELVENLRDANEETSDFGKKKSPLYGKFDQLLVRLESLLNDTRYDFLLKPQRRTSTETLTDLMNDFVGLGEPKANITVLDLSAVPFDVTPMVTAQVGRLAYEFNFWNPNCREFPIYLICEEAHEYIPREDDPRYREARKAMERIAKNGRKYGVGICVVSQRPHDVSETVLAQCSTYICLRISNPNDQEYVRAMVPDAARDTFSALTSLAKGEAVALGEGVPMPVRFQVNMPNPPPNSTDIDYAGKWRDGGEAIDVSDLVSRWHKQKR